MNETPVTLTPDKLNIVRNAARDLAELERRAADLEEELKAVRKQISEIKHSRLPELFFEAGVDNIGVPAEGNRPAFDAEMRLAYKASIAANWSPQQRADAFEVLAELEMDYLIQTTFTIKFPVKTYEQAQKFETYLQTHNLDYTSKMDVHHASLTAALKERCQHGEVPSPAQLLAIGGYIGNTVELKQRRD